MQNKNSEIKHWIETVNAENKINTLFPTDNKNTEATGGQFTHATQSDSENIHNNSKTSGSDIVNIHKLCENNSANAESFKSVIEDSLRSLDESQEINSTESPSLQDTGSKDTSKKSFTTGKFLIVSFSKISQCIY